MYSPDEVEEEYLETSQIGIISYPDASMVNHGSFPIDIPYSIPLLVQFVFTDFVIHLSV